MLIYNVSISRLTGLCLCVCTGRDIVGVFCGFLTIVCGVFLLHAFKDVNVALSDLVDLTGSKSGSKSVEGGGGGVGGGMEERGEVITAQRTGSTSAVVLETRHHSRRSDRSPVITNGNVEPLSSEDEVFGSERQPFVQSDTS